MTWYNTSLHSWYKTRPYPIKEIHLIGYHLWESFELIQHKSTVLIQHKTNLDTTKYSNLDTTQCPNLIPHKSLTWYNKSSLTWYNTSFWLDTTKASKNDSRCLYLTACPYNSNYKISKEEHWKLVSCANKIWCKSNFS